MLFTAVIPPECFSKDNFTEPLYALNMEMLLRGILSNGVLLVDQQKQLYSRLCDSVELLAQGGRSKNSHLLFEELLKQQRQKNVKFVATECCVVSEHPDLQKVSCVAKACKTDSVIVDASSFEAVNSHIGGEVPVLQVDNYINSKLEQERRRWTEGMPSVDQLGVGEFEQLIVKATRFSKWLRFYDKQIGKGTNLSNFKRGLEKVIGLWIANSHYPPSQLNGHIYTVVDDGAYRQYEPAVAYNRVLGDLVQPLRREFGISINLSFKKDASGICHARHMQAQSIAILFEGGFDLVDANGKLYRSFMQIDGGCLSHLKEYRDLPDYTP